MSERVLLGTGILTWDRTERISGRYGHVYLLKYGDSLSESEYGSLAVPGELVGARGTLLARVVESRRSTHVGDNRLQVYPARPETGEEIVLGAGFLQTGRNCDDVLTAGVAPDPWPEERDPEDATAVDLSSAPDPLVENGFYTQVSTDAFPAPWMDPRALYRAHEQTVELYFIPEG